jgi:hypothetical protein
MLENGSEFEIILIQEPWFDVVATLRSDTDPTSISQLGVAMHPEWDAHLPKHRNGDTCKAIAYTKKGLQRLHIIDNILNHPLANPNSIIIDVKEDNQVIARLINTYHAVPPTGHNLQYLFDYDAEDLIPTIIVGDFNTHLTLWSMKGKTPSAWARVFEDWLERTDFLVMNPHREPTWRSHRDTDQPSVIDLVLANLYARISGQLNEVAVSWEEGLASDHVALLFSIYPSDSIALLPAPAPNGYKAKPENWASWVEAFVMSLPPCLPYAPPHSTVPTDLSVIRCGVMAHEHLIRLMKDFDSAVKEACKMTLKPKRAPDPRGAMWWSEECTRAHIAARNARDGINRQEATKALCMALMKAKKKWAHDRLHKAEDARDIWRMTQICKGRRTNLFPAMRNSSDNPVTEPEGKVKLFRQRFFPADLRPVNTIQHDDPPPLNTRTWANIMAEEITEALQTSSTKSALGPSGIGYTILKWAHTARPEALTIIFNLCLETGKHPWNEVTIVILNKPQKPDYSVAKAYRPISLLECIGKVLEKIVANRINTDILNHDILPSTQFGS